MKILFKKTEFLCKFHVENASVREEEEGGDFTPEEVQSFEEELNDNYLSKGMIPEIGDIICIVDGSLVLKVKQVGWGFLDENELLIVVEIHQSAAVFEDDCDNLENEGLGWLKS